ERYRQELKDLPLILPWQQQDTYSAYHLYVIRLPEKTAHTHKQVFVDLRARGIGVNIHYIPVHLQPYYQNLGFKKGDFPNAESYYKTAISIPMYSALTVDDQSYVISSLKEVLK
ncbi:MAG: DegT/DnrJ/EryC1/StrS family aminotransferase, partial [Bacillota bacterium]